MTTEPPREPGSAGAAEVPRRLVINADDLGLSVRVNEGIEEAVEAGVVTSASLMVNTPAFEDGVARARRLGARLGVGLHLNLIVGKPVAGAAAVPTLVDGAGRFLSRNALLLKAARGGVRADEVRCEAAAQLAKLRASGLVPTHVDSHQHVHAFPGIRGAVWMAALAAGVSVVRRPVEPLFARPVGAAGVVKRLMLSAAWFAPLPGPRPRPGATAFRGLVLLGSRRYEAGLLETLDTLPEGSTELVVHPGRMDPDLGAWDPYIEGRVVELRALLAPAVRARLGRGDIILSRFGAS